MAQKNAAPTREQAEAMRRSGLDPKEWVVVKDYPNSMILKRRGSDEYHMSRK